MACGDIASPMSSCGCRGAPADPASGCPGCSDGASPDVASLLGWASLTGLAAASRGKFWATAIALDAVARSQIENARRSKVESHFQALHQVSMSTWSTPRLGKQASNKRGAPNKQHPRRREPPVLTPSDQEVFFDWLFWEATLDAPD